MMVSHTLLYRLCQTLGFDTGSCRTLAFKLEHRSPTQEFLYKYVLTIWIVKMHIRSRMITVEGPRGMQNAMGDSHGARLTAR